MTFNKSEIRKHAEKFDDEIFKLKIQSFIESKYAEFKKNKHWNVIESSNNLINDYSKEIALDSNNNLYEVL